MGAVLLALAGCSAVITGSAQPAPGGRSAPGGQSTSGGTLAPKIPGWHVVTAPKVGLAYDVPPSWKVDSPATIIGFTDQAGNPVVGMSNAATYLSGYCPANSGSTRGGAGVTTAQTTDPAQAASDAAKAWGNAGYNAADGTPPVIAPAQPQATTVLGVVGALVHDTLTMIKTTSCDPTGAEIDVVAWPLKAPQSGCGLFILYADQGTPDSADVADLIRIVSSLRPA